MGERVRRSGALGPKGGRSVAHPAHGLHRGLWVGVRAVRGSGAHGYVSTTSSMRRSAPAGPAKPPELRNLSGAWWAAHL